MSAHEHPPRLEDWTITRRDALRGALAGGVLATSGGLLAACGSEDVAVPTRDYGATSLKDVRNGGTPAHRGGGRRGRRQHRRPRARDRARHLARLPALRAAGGPRHRLRVRARAGRVDRAREGRGGVDGPPAAGHHLPQRQARDRRRRAVLAAAHHRSQGPEDGGGLDLLHRSRALAQARQANRAPPAEVSRTSASPTTSASTSTRSCPRTTTRRSRSGPGRSSSTASPPASGACSSRTPTTGATACRGSTRS